MNLKSNNLIHKMLTSGPDIISFKPLQYQVGPYVFKLVLSASVISVLKINNLVSVEHLNLARKC